MAEKKSNEEEINKYNKLGLATIVTKKIYNMAPEDCSSCNKSYYFKPGEHCVLTCLRCNRGACNDCYEKEKNIIKNSSMFYRSTFFACTSCKSLIVNQGNEEKTLLKKNNNKKSPATNTVNNATTVPEAIVPEETAEVLDEVIEIPEDNTGDTEIVPTEDILEKTEVTTDNTKDTQSPKAACKYYQKNICKHGISGKGCDFKHQKPCSRLLKRGECQKDGKCQAFHPQMCKSSVHSRLCTNPRCAFMHVKGTKIQNKNDHNKHSNVKSVGKSFNTKHNPKTTSSKNIQNPTANNERITVNPSTVPKTGNKPRTFLGLGQPSPPQHPPPPLFQGVIGI